MPSGLKQFILTLCFASLVFGQDAKLLDIKTFADNVFLGQIYPSGKIYVKSIKDNPDNKSFNWPKSIQFHALVANKTHGQTKTFFSATWEKLFSNPERSSQINHAYIPAYEQMPHNHMPCSKDTLKPNKDYTYLNNTYYLNDFFDLVLDYCAENSTTAVYNSNKKSNFSYPIIAFTSTIGEPISITRYSKKTLRPLFEDEKKQILEHKAAYKKLDENDSCTTVASYLDSAQTLYHAKFNDGNAIRVSFYNDAGCHGHSSTNYIVDLIKQKKVLASHSLQQYHGPI
ncbi:MAG TPA: hypothetical protein PKC21_06065 [Oligoflexia bacterium]|nr:hypothetical protein [Oligoflexia bacterium]HMR24900.1 hypothetical protein [Oligoflexia bacterium]